MAGSVEVIADLVGIVGVGLTLAAYFLLQIDKISSTGRNYSLLNTIGAALILYSLYFNWNTPAVIMETAWFMISLYGLIRHYNPKPS
ncbi:MAG: hypothetical protein HYX61_03285 [Gammaproteobacteria bacterium]|nr:hypothetical protein [Gammaproteobacteria bacterium]